ncbi:MAG: Flp pilus assembly complex ATPase component TadA [Candidatus Sericytochromatia bacterium]|nr:Flp pilus assembly complex ATPase component TadA [Candidatus Sericytochromatia bacterium]
MDEAIAQLKTTRPTFYRWLRAGKLKGHKVGRQWRFYPDDLARFLQGEPPRIDLPVGIGPLMAELQQQLQELWPEGQALPACAENAEGAVELILSLSVCLQAESLHLECIYAAPGEVQALLRCRIDGVLQLISSFDRRLLPPLLHAFGQRAGSPLNPEQTWQSGQFYFQPACGQGYDVALQSFQNGLGGALSARLTPHSQHETIDIASIALPEAVEHQLRAALASGWGMILASGPSDSGKTTTLYAALNSLAGPGLKSFSLHPGAEMHLPWVTGLRAEAPEAIAGLLKALSQADPDLVLLSEMPDPESLQQALRLALNGHLILSQLQASSAVEALLQLSERSGNAFSISEATRLILNQRLVRRLCPDCRYQGELPAAWRPRLERLFAQDELPLPEGPVWLPGKGEHCPSGYRGALTAQ